MHGVYSPGSRKHLWFVAARHLPNPVDKASIGRVPALFIGGMISPCLITAAPMCRVAQVSHWPYSSFHRYVKQGWLPATWASNIESLNGAYFGE